MSSSNATFDLIESLNNVSNLLNRYLSIVIYVFGTIGNCLNILVLSQRSLRSNPSAICFLVSSLAGVIVIISGLTSRVMSGYDSDLTLTVGWICKIRNFVLYASRTLLLWMIVLATVDRWLSSSVTVNLRQMSSLKNARRGILVLLIYTSLINAPILYCYEANLSGALRGCYGSTYICSISTDLIYAFGTTLLPLLLMIIFGLLTIKNVQHIQSRIQTRGDIRLSLENRNVSSNLSGQSRKKKTDRQLLKMLVVQVILLFIFTCPHAVQKVYSSFAPSPPSGSYEDTLEDLIFNVVTLMAFIASGMPFYIYTLTGGSLFRNTLVTLLKLFAQKCFCH